MLRARVRERMLRTEIGKGNKRMSDTFSESNDPAEPDLASVRAGSGAIPAGRMGGGGASRGPRRAVRGDAPLRRGGQGGTSRRRPVRRYRIDWAHFTRCWFNGRRGPARLAGDGRAVSHRRGEGQVSTLQRRLSSISQAHAAGFAESPTKTALVRSAFQGIRREKGAAKVGKDHADAGHHPHGARATDAPTHRGPGQGIAAHRVRGGRSAAANWPRSCARMSPSRIRGSPSL